MNINRDFRIVSLKGVHQEVGAARNLGLDHAVGKYTTFIDGDYLVYRRYLENLYNAMLNFDTEPSML